MRSGWARSGRAPRRGDLKAGEAAGEGGHARHSVCSQDLAVGCVPRGTNAIDPSELIGLVTLPCQRPLAALCSRLFSLGGQTDTNPGVYSAGLAPPCPCLCTHQCFSLKFPLPLLCLGVTSSRKPHGTPLQPSGSSSGLPRCLCLRPCPVPHLRLRSSLTVLEP